ncbi:MAG: efflux RND transporter periplasmic adaptor subunit [Bacteroidales bacterium]|nr:efflux RND transporter periplasmic adaptor subunit [Bacteroidales bacterium]
MKTITTIAAAALTTLSVSACFDVPKETHTSFETVVLERKSITIPTTRSVTVVGKNDVVISPQISGQLMKVCVTEGQRVKAGDLLFVIDEKEPEMLLANAKSSLLAAKSRCNVAELEYESNRHLYSKKIVSDYILKASRNEFEQAKAAMAQAESDLARAELNLSHCRVTSPVDGKVGSIGVNPGDQVSQFDALTNVSGDRVMKANFSITETQLQEIIRDCGSIEKALEMMPEVSLQLKDGTVYPHKGRITSLSGMVDQATGSVKGVAMFDNPEGFLYSGIQGNLIIEFSYDGVITVPIPAIVRIQDKTLVYRVRDNKAESVIVVAEEVGNGKDMVIFSGIEAGETIVANGAANVHDGQQVIFPEGESTR